mmetsp:Transcript_14434/g.57521  ORF Transcript_14434/g.57521 Transcript_14434/m.57521 type:complete len:432 (+) Transcript_14434:1001-2296(+)
MSLQSYRVCLLILLLKVEMMCIVVLRAATAKGEDETPLHATRRPAREEAHGVLRGVERLGRDGVRLVGAFSEHVVQARLVGHDVVVARLYGLQMRDDGVGEPGLEGPPRQVTDLVQDRLSVEVGDGLVDVEQVGALGPLRVVPLEPREGVGLAALDLLGDDVGRVEEVDARRVEFGRLGHLRGAVRERHDARAVFDDERFGLAKHLALLAFAKLVVEAARDVARQLQVLALVLADGHEPGLVQQDVGRHEHGVVEEADADVLALLDGLFLVLDHALEPVHRCRAVEQPGEFGVRRDVRLQEDGRLVGVDAGRHVRGGGLQRVLRELLGVVRHRDGVEIDDEVPRFRPFGRQLDPLPNGAEVVPEMQRARRLHARKHAVAGLRCGLLRGLCFRGVCDETLERRRRRRPTGRRRRRARGGPWSRCPSCRRGSA